MKLINDETFSGENTSMSVSPTLKRQYNVSSCLFLAFEPIYSWQKNKKKSFQHAYDLSYFPCFSMRHKCKLMCSNILTQGSAWQISRHTFLRWTDALKAQSAPFGCIIPALFSFANEIKLYYWYAHTRFCIFLCIYHPKLHSYICPFAFAPQALEQQRMRVASLPHPYQRGDIWSDLSGFLVKGKEQLQTLASVCHFYMQYLMWEGWRHVAYTTSVVMHLILAISIHCCSKKAKTDSHFWKSEKRVGECMRVKFWKQLRVRAFSHVENAPLYEINITLVWETAGFSPHISAQWLTAIYCHFSFWLCVRVRTWLSRVTKLKHHVQRFTLTDTQTRGPPPPPSYTLTRFPLHLFWS